MSRVDGGCVWIQGAGELASGVAFRLIRCGYRVILAEVPQPRSVRRRVCFSEAVHGGSCVVEGIPGRLHPVETIDFRAGEAAVTVDPLAEALARLRPAAVVDARMTKREPAPLPTGDSLRIGLGPGFLAGENCDRVIETHRGARLGEVIEAGAAAADTGVPGPVGGRTSERLLRSPAAGRLEPRLRIGDLVEAGEMVGTVAGEPVISKIDGMLRGLVHPAVELSPGEKVGDVDPRGPAIDPDLVSDKALAVAGGVLEALLAMGAAPWAFVNRR